MTDERAIIKLGLKTGAGSSHRKSVQAPIRFVHSRSRVNESASIKNIQNENKSLKCYRVEITFL